MGLTCYLAMTSAEFNCAEVLPEHSAWMACHFSCYGTGLSNLPDTLPPGSMIIVNDRTPPRGHDPKRITEQLEQLLSKLEQPCLLLDFQRVGCEETALIAKAITESIHIPTAISEPYAKNANCAVFLSCPLPHKALAPHLAPWKDREVWLEAATEWETATLASDGCRFCSFEGAPDHLLPFRDTQLHCSYQTEVFPDHAVFTLHRDPSQVKALLHEAQELGIKQAVGLYQQLHSI